jgi:glycosyltransferase involved in cell wall biosynthesis
MMENELKILTNHPGQDSSITWKRHTRYIPSRKASYISAFILGAKLYLARTKHDCVVLGAWRSDFVFAIFQSLLPFKKAPTIMIDCLWYDTGSSLKRLVRKIALKIIDKGIDRYCVWANREVDAYSKAFGLPKEKFVYIPYHTTLDNQDLEDVTKDGGYLFSGGNFQRDYKTLFMAVKDLPVQLEVACTIPEIFAGIDIPDNVFIKGYSHSEYLKKMAGCKISIIPLDAKHLHSGGQQTILNSMWLGKPTIVTDPDGACDYIDNGVDGVLVTPENPEELRIAILKLLQYPEYAKDMGLKARQKVKGYYSTEDHFQKIVSLAKTLVGT